MKYLWTFILFAIVSYSTHTVHSEQDFPVKNDTKNINPIFFVGSPPLLQSLAQKEQQIFLIITKFKETQLKNLETTNNSSKIIQLQNLETVQSYFKSFEGSTNDFHQKNEVSGNPIFCYLLIKRFVKDLPKFLQSLQTIGSDFEESLELKGKISNLMSDIGWPTENDLISSMDAIIRIQIVYNLPADELAKGRFKDQETNVRLNLKDCHRIGKYLLETECCPSMALEWLQLQATNANESDNSEFVKLLKKDLTQAKIMNESRTDQLQRGKNRFWNLCSGETQKSSEQSKNLFCWYETKQGQGALSINPIKSELLSLDPLIVQYYDFLGPTLMDKLKNYSTPQLGRSKVFDDEQETDGVDGDVANYRTSFTSWLTEGEFNEFRHIPKLIEFVTGLTVTKVGAAERLQLAAYGSGGHYQVHVDDVPKPTVSGGRIATFMIYLSQVDQGGFTAFPIAGVAAKPIKGSAVFWYNFLSCGHLDERTEHGACPVILGEKWVANKWILFEQQFSSHKCQEKSNLPFEFKVNGKLLAPRL